jgi:PBSX family phage portal protein
MTATAMRVMRNARPKESLVNARSTVIQIQRKDSDTSRQIEPIDEWSWAGAQGPWIMPPYEPLNLLRVIERSSNIQPCIDAYVTNTVQTGWEIEAVVRGQKINEGEKVELQSFLDHSNSEESMLAIKTKVVRDREQLGYGFLEGIRDATGSISLLRHAPALITRLCAKGKEETLVEYTIQRGRRQTVVKEFRRFRRFVQCVAGKIVYFKEWGDPRQMNRVSGAYKGDPKYVAGEDATEILHFKLPSNEPYGIPRWIITLPAILGSREAEETNMRYFEDNTVPPMMLTVSGGRLTAHSFNELTKAVSEQQIGKDRQNRVLIIEATGDSDSLDGKGTPVQLKVEKLTDTRQSDGLFSAYDKDNAAKVRQAWRLPAGVIGNSTEQNYANAQIAIFTADSQVFGPARCEIDEILNKAIVWSDRGLGLRSCKLVSRIPAISSPETTIKSLTALNVMGAVTPRSAQMIANKILQMEIPDFPQKGEDGYEAWMDEPIQLAKAASAPENTHDEQAGKTQAIKDTEAEGNPGFQRPENGAEGEVITA